jgi:UDP-N-acetylmuramate-alanine ligase
MHIYFSGIGGVGLGPLAEIARDAGYDVSGSDTTAGLTTAELIKSEIDVICPARAPRTPADRLVRLYIEPGKRPARAECGP